MLKESESGADSRYVVAIPDNPDFSEKFSRFGRNLVEDFDHFFGRRTPIMISESASVNYKFYLVTQEW